ncbi:MAG TPA: DUF4410 domain-containing protein [Pyrinomonadaceae bacterium]|jgi:hypothetical protein
MNHAVERALFSLLAVLALVATVVAGGQKKDDGLKNQYQNIEVAQFDVKEGVEFPAENMTGMMDEIVSELQDIKKFKQVTRAGATPVDAASAPTIQLVGTVTEYKAGSRAKRYLIGFGAGKTKVVAHVKFIDKATGNVLLERDVDGKVVLGLFGGKSKTSLRDVGKEIASVAKKKFF